MIEERFRVQVDGVWYAVPPRFVDFSASGDVVVSWEALYGDATVKSNHGTTRTYRQGCRCPDCLHAKAGANRKAYLKRTQEERR